MQRMSANGRLLELITEVAVISCNDERIVGSMKPRPTKLGGEELEFR